MRTVRLHILPESIMPAQDPKTPHQDSTSLPPKHLGKNLAIILLIVSLPLSVYLASSHFKNVMGSQKDTRHTEHFSRDEPDGGVEANSNDDMFLSIVEDMPEMIGGLNSLYQSIKYPNIAKQAGIEGRVFIQFVVDVDGSVIDPVIIRGIGGGCDEEAIRALKQARFKPGKQHGIPVPVRMSIPISFELANHG